MESFLLGLHSGVRWLVVLATVLVIGKLILNLVQGSSFDTLTSRLLSAWAGLTSIQFLIGVVLFLVLGGFNVGYRWEHAITMFIAVGLSHMHRRFKDAPDQIRNRNTLILVLVVLALVFVGVWRLPGERGW